MEEEVKYPSFHRLRLFIFCQFASFYSLFYPKVAQEVLDDARHAKAERERRETIKRRFDHCRFIKPRPEATKETCA